MVEPSNVDYVGFILLQKKTYRLISLSLLNGADDGNRTHVVSLEGWGSTIKLHPHMSLIASALNFRMTKSTKKVDIFNYTKIRYFVNTFLIKKLVIILTSYLLWYLHLLYWSLIHNQIYDYYYLLLHLQKQMISMLMLM